MDRTPIELKEHRARMLRSQHIEDIKRRMMRYGITVEELTSTPTIPMTDQLINKRADSRKPKVSKKRGT